MYQQCMEPHLLMDTATPRIIDRTTSSLIEFGQLLHQASLWPCGLKRSINSVYNFRSPTLSIDVLAEGRPWSKSATYGLRSHCYWKTSSSWRFRFLIKVNWSYALKLGTTTATSSMQLSWNLDTGSAFTKCRFGGKHVSFHPKVSAAGSPTGAGKHAEILGITWKVNIALGLFQTTGQLVFPSGTLPHDHGWNFY
ncbi:hypothetical protein VNO77_27325 [Canavalia gladiata]|uniref:Uncharacterized protein n=1 Tax=Canavalia gladiata TaxID=3824 RepID=A0AAN9KXM9_CANGL